MGNCLLVRKSNNLTIQLAKNVHSRGNPVTLSHTFPSNVKYCIAFASGANENGATSSAITYTGSANLIDSKSYESGVGTGNDLKINIYKGIKAGDSIDMSARYYVDLSVYTIN